jgi:hypothetical protein
MAISKELLLFFAMLYAFHAREPSPDVFNANEVVFIQDKKGILGSLIAQVVEPALQECHEQAETILEAICNDPMFYQAGDALFEALVSNHHGFSAMVAHIQSTSMDRFFWFEMFKDAEVSKLYAEGWSFLVAQLKLTQHLATPEVWDIQKPFTTLMEQLYSRDLSVVESESIVSYFQANAASWVLLYSMNAMVPNRQVKKELATTFRDGQRDWLLFNYSLVYQENPALVEPYLSLFGWNVDSLIPLQQRRAEHEKAVQLLEQSALP